MYFTHLVQPLLDFIQWIQPYPMDDPCPWTSLLFEKVLGNVFRLNFVYCNWLDFQRTKTASDIPFLAFLSCTYCKTLRKLFLLIRSFLTDGTPTKYYVLKRLSLQGWNWNVNKCLTFSGLHGNMWYVDLMRKTLICKTLLSSSDRMHLLLFDFV